MFNKVHKCIKFDQDFPASFTDICKFKDIRKILASQKVLIRLQKIIKKVRSFLLEISWSKDVIKFFGRSRISNTFLVSLNFL